LSKAERITGLVRWALQPARRRPELRCQPHPAGLNAGQVQQLRDEAEQAFRAASGALRLLALALTQSRVQGKDLGKSQH